MTFKALFMFLALAGVSALAISCVAPVQMSQTENTKPIETVTVPAADDFTTVGKPTKTIETPWGPREVYDPEQDAEVRAAFELIYNINSDRMLISDSDTNRMQELEDQYPNVRILRQSLRAQRASFAKNNCQIFASAECGSWWQQIHNDECNPSHQDSCEMRYVRAQVNTRLQCPRNEETIYSRNQHPIGRKFHSKEPSRELMHVPNLEDQLQNFFHSSCAKWINQGVK